MFSIIANRTAYLHISDTHYYAFALRKGDEYVIRSIIGNDEETVFIIEKVHLHESLLPIISIVDIKQYFHFRINDRDVYGIDRVVDSTEEKVKIIADMMSNPKSYVTRA